MPKKQQIRQNATKRSKYGQIVLPTEIDGIFGYHSSCYKTFTAISVPKSPKPTTQQKSEQLVCLYGIYVVAISQSFEYNYLKVSIYKTSLTIRFCLFSEVEDSEKSDCIICEKHLVQYNRARITPHRCQSKESRKPYVKYLNSLNLLNDRKK